MLAQTYTTTSVDAGASIVVLLVELVFGLAWLGFQIWVLMQIMKPSEAEYTAAGQNRGLWVGLGVLGLCCFGIIIDLIWFLAIKPKIEEARQGGYGGAPGGYVPPQPQ